MHNALKGPAAGGTKAGSHVLAASATWMLWPLAVTAVGLALRLNGLAALGLWFDETHSVHMARLGLADLLSEISKDIHPPLYFAVLGLWLRLVGTSEFALRYLSVGLGTLIIPLMYVLGRSVGGARLGRVAAVIVACSPLLVYYGQEVRMYAPSAALVAALGVMAWRGIRGAPPGRWVGPYVAFGAVAAYFHLYNLLPVFAFNVAYALLALPALLADRSRGRRWTRWRPVMWWAAAQLGIIVLLLPWFPVLLSKGLVASGPTDQPTALDAVATDLARGFAVGLLADPGRYDWLTTAVWGLGGLGLISGILPALWRRERRTTLQGVMFAGLWLAVSLAVMYVTLAGRRDFAPRYLISALPGFVLLLSAGLVLLLRNRWLVAAGVAALVGLTALPLADYYREPLAATRPDQRGAIRLLEGMARPGDAVVMDAYYASSVFEYYDRLGLPYVGLPATEPPDRAATQKALADLTARHGRIWTVYWQDYFTDPDRIVESWLDAQTLRFFEYGFQGWVRVKGYERRQPGETVFGNAIRLAGYEITPRPLVAGQPATVKLQWNALAPLPKDYNVFVHIVDKDYKFVGQHDGPPNRGKSPTSTWRPGWNVTDEHDLQVAADAAPGDYYVRVGLYSLADMQRLPTALSDNLLLGTTKLVVR